jgi:addiction module HigA family antidote
MQERRNMAADMKPIHPGEVLLEVYMKTATPPVTTTALSETLSVPEQLLANLIHGSQSITASLATQLSVVCRTTPEYWLQLQKTYDREVAKNKKRQRHENSTHTDHPAAAA